MEDKQEEKLKEILKNIKISWNNRNEINEISEALNSTSNYIKRGAIQKYKKYLTPTT